MQQNVGHQPVVASWPMLLAVTEELKKQGASSLVLVYYFSYKTVSKHPWQLLVFFDPNLSKILLKLILLLRNSSFLHSGSPELA